MPESGVALYGGSPRPVRRPGGLRHRVHANPKVEAAFCSMAVVMLHVQAERELPMIIDRNESGLPQLHIDRHKRSVLRERAINERPFNACRLVDVAEKVQLGFDRVDEFAQCHSSEAFAIEDASRRTMSDQDRFPVDEA